MVLINATSHFLKTSILIDNEKISINESISKNGHVETTDEENGNESIGDGGSSGGNGDQSGSRNDGESVYENGSENGNESIGSEDEIINREKRKNVSEK